MRTKFVARVLDEAHQLLAWAEVWAVATPLGGGRSCQFWPEAPTRFRVTQAGTACLLTVHWCDLDIARQTPLAATSVTEGQVFDFTWIEPVWLAPAMANVPLPAVTLDRSVELCVPAGALVAAPAA